MSDILCVTNRSLCREDFLIRISRIAEAGPAGIVLREKDLGEKEYGKLAAEVMRLCKAYGVRCILHSFIDVAVALRADSIHLPLPLLMGLKEDDRARFREIGASCHSVEEAVAAESQGCTYITAGHIFDTDCKKGLPGRGIDFLKKVCGSVSIPVYSIGGISAGNIAKVREAGAAGACVMSGAMVCEDVRAYFSAFEVRK